MAQSDAAFAAAGVLPDLWSSIKPETTLKNRTGRGVRVAVIDSGIDTEHPDLLGKVKGSVEAYVEGGKVHFREST